MGGQIVERFCIAMLLFQAGFFLVVQFKIIDPWFFPATVFFPIFVFLGLIVSLFGFGIIVKSLLYRQSFRLELLMVCGLSVITFVSIQLTYGWENVDFKKANDYTTDIIDIPQFQQSKHERLHVKEVSPIWGFMDIPHTVSQADVGSIFLRLNGLDAKIVVKEATSNLGWLHVRYSITPRDGIRFNETHQFLAGNPGVNQRTDVVVRIVSTELGFSIVDIRSSSPGRRRDLGFNSLMIRKLANEIVTKAAVYRAAQDLNLIVWQ